MRTYKLREDGIGVDFSDGGSNGFIPEGGMGWDAYQAWLAEGNTPAPAYMLEELKRRKLDLLQSSMSLDYLYEHYDAGTQSTFLARYIKLSANPVGNAGKLALLDSVDSWMGTVLTRYYQLKGVIIAAPDNATLDAISWDFPPEFDATDPHVSIPQVM